jgi:hypothetical protein
VASVTIIGCGLRYCLRVKVRESFSMPRSINGTGTVWYGNALPEPDGSYVVTEWVTFLCVPLLPLGSKRVIWDEQRHRQNEAKSWWSRQRNVDYYRTVKVPLHVPHLLKGYAVTAGIFLVCAIFG